MKVKIILTLLMRSVKTAIFPPMLRQTLVMLIISASCLANTMEKTWYDTEYSEKRLKSRFKSIKKKYSHEKLQEIFKKRNIFCESNLFSNLSKLSNSKLKYAIVYAHKNMWLDEVEADILTLYAKSYSKASTARPESTFRIKKGQKLIDQVYKDLFSKGQCVSKNWARLTESVALFARDNNQKELLAYLNYRAYSKKFITRDQLRQLNMMLERSDEKTSEFSINDYYAKKEQLEEAGFELNHSVRDFHIKKRDKKSKLSARYAFYTKYSTFQIKEMLALLGNLNKRASAYDSQIIYLERDGDILETVDLNHTQKLRLSMKLFTLEKNKLLKKDYFSNTNFSYRDLVIASYETKKINELDLEFLGELEKKSKKKGFWSKLLTGASNYDFLATVIAGPTVGFIYSLSVSMANAYVTGAEKKKASYEHDLFYGNCEAGL